MESDSAVDTKRATARQPGPGHAKGRAMHRRHPTPRGHPHMCTTTLTSGKYGAVATRGWTVYDSAYDTHIRVCVPVMLPFRAQATHDFGNV